MGVVLHRLENASWIELAGAIDISVAAELKAALLEAVADGKDICISTESLTDLDVTAYQLLWAASRETRRSGVAFRLSRELPQQLQESFKEIGLDALEPFAESALGAEQPGRAAGPISVIAPGTE